LIGCRNRWFLQPFSGRQFLPGLAPNGEPFGTVEPVDPFMIDALAFSFQQDVESSVTKSRPLFGQLAEPRDQNPIFFLSRAVSLMPLGRAPEAQH